MIAETHNVTQLASKARLGDSEVIARIKRLERRERDFHGAKLQLDIALEIVRKAEAGGVHFEILSAKSKAIDIVRQLSARIADVLEITP